MREITVSEFYDLLSPKTTVAVIQCDEDKDHLCFQGMAMHLRFEPIWNNIVTEVLADDDTLVLYTYNEG